MTGSDVVAAQTSSQMAAADLCSGCGACASSSTSPNTVVIDRHGRLQASNDRGYTEREREDFLEICPFSGVGPDEDDIAQKLFVGNGVTRDQRIGSYRECYVGSVEDGSYRERGSSGGLGTWLAAKLLDEGLVDGVLHVTERQDSASGLIYGYSISRSSDEVALGAKSRYYPVEMSEVLQRVREVPGRYALVGVPCFIKAARRLAIAEPAFGERIVYYLGIVCGHLKSADYADAIAWEAGIHPDELASIDFRHKLADRPANMYGARVTARSGEEVVRPMEGLTTADWGVGLFRYPACDMCDDVLAETADVAIGDAWLPERVADSRGTNVVVVRNQELHELIASGIRGGQLQFDTATADEVAQTQGAGLRHRRDGLAYRLHLRELAGTWSPAKRVEPSADHLTARQRRVFELRSRFTNEAPEAFLRARQRNDFRAFLDWYEPLAAEYRMANRAAFVRRVVGFAARTGRSLRHRFDAWPRR